MALMERTTGVGQSLVVDDPADIGSALIGTSLAEGADRPTRLFDRGQLDVRWDKKAETLWTFMTPIDRPNFNLSMLSDFHIWQSEIERMFAGRGDCPRYLVLGSRFPGIFNLGGDIEYFAECIRACDREKLVAYGRSCVQLLHRNMNTLNLPMVTVALVQGDALGGGFEALLSFNVIVAERGSRFGMPETAFGLFPGMGAHCFLSRRLGMAKAERLILGGETLSAEEMYDLGIVHVLAEPGEGEAAVAAYIEKNRRRQPGHVGLYAASRLVSPIPLAELEAVVEIWADAALNLKDSHLKLMQRLAAAQTRLAVDA